MGWCADIAVEVEDLRINHGKCPLVRVSHLQIRFGERVAVIGRSGAGKSLLAGALTGTVPATVSVTGKITLAGHIRGGEAVTGISGALFGTVAFARQDSADALNPLVSITDQLAIRAAARAAVDRATLVDTVYEGRADVAAGLLGPALPWAAELREESPYTSILSEQVEPARPDEVDGAAITLGTFTDRSELPEVAVRLEQQLQAAGFTVTQDVREYQYIEADAIDGEFDAFILSRATVLDSGDPVAYMYSDFACDGSFNISQFCDAEVDQALANAAAIVPGPERQEAIMQAEALILQHDAAVPMLHERVIQGEVSGASGVERDPRERMLITGDSAVSAEAR